MSWKGARDLGIVAFTLNSHLINLFTCRRAMATRPPRQAFRHPHRESSNMKITFAKVAMVAVMSAAALSVAPSSFAGTKSATFQVSLTVEADCAISANPLNFGTTGVIDNNLDQTTSL